MGNEDKMRTESLYKNQGYGAKTRGIEWKLTYEQWLNIWTQSGHLAERGRKKGQYCMSRYGDTGAYEVGNVFIQTHGANITDAKKGKILGPQTVEHRRKVSIAKTGKIRGPQTNEIKQKRLKSYRATIAKRKQHG